MWKARNVKKIVSGAIVLGLLTMNFGLTKSYAEEVNIAIKSSPNIDVVLTLGNSNVNASNFEGDLKSRLQSKSIDTSKVHIESVVAREETVFLGKFAMNIYWDNNSTDMDSHVEFWGGGQKIDEMFYGKKAVFGSTLDRDDTSGGVGEWSTINFDTIPSNVDELRFYVNPYRGSAQTSLRLVRTLNGKQETLIDWPLYVSSKTYFGKLVRNDSAWDFVYNNGVVYSGKQVVVQAKKFSEVIRQPSWREGSTRFLVNLEDQPVSDFDNAQASGEISTRLINEEISYVAMGTSTNQSQANNFIQRNNGNGTFINNTNYSYAMDQLATYIYNKVKDQQSQTGDSQYVLVNEPLNIDVVPSELKTNTQTAEYPQGRWRVDHDYNYFENSLGQAANSGQYQKDLQVTFDKPGRYELWFGDSHPNPRYVYAHRRPIANFTLNVQANGNNFAVTTNNQSYDPDYQSTSDKGIEQTEWKWRETTATTWNDGQIPSSLPLGKDYIVQLRVKDKQGAWSLPEARYVTTSNVVAKPVANFELPTVASRYDNLNVSDTSYDPAGRAISQRQWTVKKDGTTVYSGATLFSSFNSYGRGAYEVSLKVQNNAGLWSEEFKRTITITEDETKPELTVNPARQDWTNQDVNVTASFSDAGGSGFNSQRYAVSNSIEIPTSGWSEWNTNPNQTITLSNEGKWYIHIQAKDNAGNALERTMGEYQIDKTKPTQPKIDFSSNQLSITPGTDSNLLNTLYQLNDGLWIPYENAITLQDGIYVVKAKSIDKAGNESDEVTLTKVVNNTALAAVEAAEVSPSYDAVDQAQTLVNNLPDSPEKNSLQDRLDKVKSDLDMYQSIQDGIDEISKAINRGSLTMADVTSLKEKTKELQNKLNALPGTLDKPKLQSQLDSLKQKLQLIESIFKTKGDEVTEVDLGGLQDQLDQLPDGDLKDQLQQELDNAKALQEATREVEKAEQTKSESQIEKARDLVIKLPDGKAKEDLLNRLDRIEKEIKDIDIDPVESIDTIKNSTIKKLLLNVESFINIAEKYKTRATIVNAIEKVDGIPQDIRGNSAYQGIVSNFESRVAKLKSDYNGGVQDQVDEQALKKATSYVEYYEKYRSSFYKSKAEEYVSALPDGEIKNGLQARIDAVIMK